MAITPEEARAELQRREALKELQRRGIAPTPEAEEERPGLLGRAAKGLWNAAVAGPVAAIRTQSSAGQVRRDVEIMKQYRLARERGEAEPAYQEAARRADEAIAGRDQKPLAVGGTAGQVLAGNVLPLPEAETIPEKVADVGAGVAGFVANLAATKKLLPGTPEPLAWEMQNQASGGLPGEGAAMAGVLGAVGKSSLPVAGKLGAEAAIFGGLAAASGGDAEDIAIAAGIPLALGGTKAGKRALKRRAEAKQLASDKAVMERAAAEQPFAPAVEDTTSAGADVAVKPRMRMQAELGKDVAPTAGAAPAAEPLPSARQAYIETRRESVGLPAVPERLPRGTRAQWTQEAIEQGKVDKAFNIANDILTTPRPATPQESGGMFIRSERIAAEYDAINEKIAKLPAGSTERGALASQAAELGKQYEVLSKVLHQAGTSWGQAGNVRRGLLGDNTNTLSVIGRAKTAAGGELKPEVEATLIKSVKALREASTRSQAVTGKEKERTARRSIRRGGKLARWAKMTTAEKDAELRTLLGQEQTDRTLHDIAINIASRDPAATAESVVRKMQELIPGLEPGQVTDAIVSTTQRKAANTNATVQLLQSLKRTFRKIDKEGIAIRDALHWLKTGELPERADRKPMTEDDVVSTLKEVSAGLKRAVADSEPAQQLKMQRKLDFLNARIANMDFAPIEKQSRYEPSKRVLEMQYEASRLDGEIRRRIADQEPWTWRSTAAEPLRVVMALKSSFDMSALGNQGGWALFSHPLRTLRRVPEALAAFSSEKKAWMINEKIRQRDNAAYYFRDGLQLVEATGHAAFTIGEEQYRSNLAEYIPGIKGSNRSFATLLNLIRADSYDAMAHSFGGQGGPSMVEGKAIADFINMMTGRGNIEGYERTVSAMNGIFWAPRRAISRFQAIATLGGQLEYGRKPGKMKYSPVHLRGTSATHKMFAAEMGRYAAGLATVYTLGALAGADVELDPRSSDFGKLRFGNVRIDPLSGLSQTMVLLSREITGKTKTMNGVEALRGPDRPYKGDTMGDVGLRFLSYKVSPGLAVGWSILSGETEFDGPTTPWTVLKGSVVPMTFEDVYAAIKEQGMPRGTAIAMLGLIGMGVQIYGDELTRAEYEELYGEEP